METNGWSGGGAAPTGCYKCGRPGHWSRDCPSNPNTNSNHENSGNKPSASSHPFKASGGVGGASLSSQKQPIEKPKKAPKTRPKLTPELLLSDDGIGFVLRHFPKAFKYHGRGHEMKDLANLLNLYSEWHSHLIPYYSFNQFVHKVEQVGGSKRVKLCLKDLRERVANGGDPTEPLETPEPHESSNQEQDTINLEEPIQDSEDFQNDMLGEIDQNVTQEPSVHKESPSQTPNANGIQMSEELKARIEANRLRALERAAARKLVDVPLLDPTH